MIQGGCPLGTGTRRPRLHLRRRDPPRAASSTSPTCWRWPTPAPAPTARSSSSPSAPTPWLEPKHTIFGEVADQASRDVVDAIATTPTGAGDRPRRRRSSSSPSRSTGPERTTDRTDERPQPAGQPPGRGADLLPAPRPGVLHPLPAVRAADLPRLHARRRGRASSARSASPRARRRPAAARTAYGGLRSGNPALTSLVLIGVNALGLAGDPRDRRPATARWSTALALPPNGRCDGRARRLLPAVTRERAVLPSGDGGSWVPGVDDGADWQLLTIDVHPRRGLAHRLQHARAVVPRPAARGGPGPDAVPGALPGLGLTGSALVLLVPRPGRGPSARPARSSG